MDRNDARREIDASVDIIRRVYRQSSQPDDLEVGSLHLWEDTGTNERWLLVKDRSGTIYKLGPMNTTGTVVGSGTGAPATATYVTITADGTLTSERRLTAGTAMILTDGGAGSTVTLSLDQASAPVISGIWTFTNYTYLDSSGNQIQFHSDGAGNFVIERNGAAGTIAFGSGGSGLAATFYGDATLNGNLSITGDITGSGGTTFYGGTTASVGIGLVSTTHGTKGSISICSATGEKVLTHGAGTAYSDWTFGSGVAFPFLQQDTGITLGPTHYYIQSSTAGGAVTHSLAITNTKGRVHIIKKTNASANALTIQNSGGADRIYLLGSATANTSVVIADYSGLRLISNGSDWYEF